MTGERELLAVLARVQAGTALLAGGGQTAVMGTPLYLVLTASKPGEGELFRETDQRFEVIP